MKTKRVQKIVVSAVTLMILLMGATFSPAQEWPSKPITIIHPWAAGGASDLITRAFAEGLEKRLGVPIIVDNKPGGSGLIGAAAGANAKPDGYTLMFLSCSAITEKSIILKIPFDIIHAYSFISQIYDYSYSFVVKTDKPWKTFPEFVEAAKKQPGKLTVSSSGTGSTMACCLESLRRMPEFKTTMSLPNRGHGSGRGCRWTRGRSFCTGRSGTFSRGRNHPLAGRSGKKAMGKISGRSNMA
jgi:tripartite-type tricarboxylate transporter receptor subunit TctC